MTEWDDQRQLALLRRHEPVLRFHRGERFFPMSVEAFVEGAGLWCRARTGAAERLRPAGSLSVDRLADASSPDPDATLFLRHAMPMAPADLAKYALDEQRSRGKDPRDSFRAGRGRLARSGYLPRLVDAAFSLSLLARGRVPGDLAAAAAVAYRERMRQSEDYRYYGRVVECGHWTVLQYWYFYFFNDWRSRFFGTNDHEGDWEMVSIFLGADGDGGWQPEWVACSCHEYPGVELRRHWNDPELETRNGHPIVHVAAGSHAGYFRPGDYLAEIDLHALAPLSRAARRIRTVWRETLHQYSAEPDAPAASSDSASSALRVPFIDYARGNGHAIGPGEERSWADPVLVTSPPSWILDYRGLWGYFARDPLVGEDAPPGPMYERNGSVRLAWQDPATWCRLGATPPKERLPEVLSRLREDLSARREQRERRIGELRDELAGLGVETRLADTGRRRGKRNRGLRHREERVRGDLRRELEALAEETDVLRRLESDDPLAGSEPRTRSHLSRALRPMPDESLRADRIAEIWAALSVGLLLLGLVVLALFAHERLPIAAFLRKWLTGLVSVVAITLALVCAGVLVVEFHRPIAITLAVATGAFLLWENARELWS